MEPVVYAIFDKYIKRIRSNIPTTANTTNALVTGNGKPFTQYLHYVKSLAKEYGITNMPNPTSCRKEAATKAVSLLSKDKMETVSRHMGHSSTTSEKYYRTQQRKKEVTLAFSAMSKFIGKRFFNLATMCTILICRNI